MACDRSSHCEGDAQARLARGAEVLRRHDRTTLQLIAALIGSAYSPASYVEIDRAMRALINGRTGPWKDLTHSASTVGSELAYSRDGEMAVSATTSDAWDKEVEASAERSQDAIRTTGPRIGPSRRARSPTRTARPTSTALLARSTDLYERRPTPRRRSRPNRRPGSYQAIRRSDDRTRQGRG